MTSFALVTLAVGLLATAVSVALVPLSRAVARGAGAVDEPGGRKIHTKPTPRMGGIAIFGAFLGVVLVGYYAAVLLSARDALPFTSLLKPLAEAHRVQGRLLAILSGAAIVFLVGVLDDVLGSRFPVAVKAAGQVLAALVLVAGDVHTSLFGNHILDGALTVLWVVGITNAFNLLDNMDGLSAGVALVASAVLLANAWLLGELFVSLIFAAFIGSLLGFLFFNISPASIFLGDCGSLFIGFLMAALTLLERYVSHASSTLFPVLMPVLVLAVPIVDTTTVVLIRIKERRPIYVGDTRHLSHRLVSVGFSRRAAVLFIHLFTLCFGLGAIGLQDAPVGRSFVIMAQSLGFVALILILLFFERRRLSREEEA